MTPLDERLLAAVTRRGGWNDLARAGAPISSSTGAFRPKQLFAGLTANG
jgi:hypothetical protein